MPRQARLDAPGTMHHVIIRGIERKEIVKDNHDRQNFVYRMGTAADAWYRYVQRVVFGIQAKLAVGQPGGIYEQEADRVAGAVMHMPNLNVQRQANDTKEKLPIHAKAITPIHILKVECRKVEGEEELKKKNCIRKSYRFMFLKSLPGSNPTFLD
jgi:hypothetical protein